MATVFVSPGVYTSEQDFSAYASQIGITRLGLVGVTKKGPAFEAITVGSTAEFAARFGSTDIKLNLPYVANSFLTQSQNLTITRVLGNEGFTNSAAWVIQGSGGTYDGATLCVIRSKSADEGISFLATDETAVQIAGITGLLNPFILSATTGPLTAQTNGINVSLDETQANYIVNVLGQNPEKYASDYGFYVESIYPHFIREAASRGDISNIQTSITFSTNPEYIDYAVGFQTPETPYIVSKVAGGIVRDLFKFTSISDGDSANQEIKISIANIDDVNKVFDVIIRDFNDTDANPARLEGFLGLTLDDSKPNFIGAKIGMTDETYPAISKYVTVDMAENYPVNTVPAGFEGYSLRDSGVSGATNPNIYYKTTYLSGDSVFKTYLGISELGYTANTSSNVSIGKAIKTLEQDLWSYQGATVSGMTTIKGFHLENTAPSADFVLGGFNAVSAYTKTQAKFTLVPYGGFDGWNKFRDPAFTSSGIDANNVIAMKAGIDTLANPKEIDINLFAMPGLNFSDNEDIVKYALDMVETRADSLYIVDSPRITDGLSKGTAEEVVLALQDTGIDSNYLASYWPHLQIKDVNNNKNVFISPTYAVVAAISLTDNISYPWEAPAGFNRGSVQAIKADIKLKQTDLDTLYVGRINPIDTSIQQGITIMGQKTMQVAQTALDRVNVRRLLLQLRRLISAAASTLLFEPNDSTVRSQFLQKINPILLQIKNQRGLAQFDVILDSSPNPATPNTLSGVIRIQPVSTLEIVDLTFQVNPEGGTFQV